MQQDIQRTWKLPQEQRHTPRHTFTHLPVEDTEAAWEHFSVWQPGNRMGWPDFWETEGPTRLGWGATENSVLDDTPYSLFKRWHDLWLFENKLRGWKILLNELTQKEAGPEPDIQPLAGMFLLFRGEPDGDTTKTQTLVRRQTAALSKFFTLASLEINH